MSFFLFFMPRWLYLEFLADIAKFYPVQNFTDVYGTIFDIANKYFIMFESKKSKESNEVFSEERKWRSWADNHLVHTIKRY